MNSVAETGSTHVIAERVRAVAAVVRAVVGEASPAPAAWDDPLYWNVEAPRSDRCQFLAVGNAINFRFWSIDDNCLIPAQGPIAGQVLRGSMYMWRRLRLALEHGDFNLDAAFLASLDVPRFRRAFEADDGSFPLEPGVVDRVENLRDLGNLLAKHWEGQFVRVVDAAGGSIDHFAALSAEFRAFDDPVRKLTMVNAIMLSGSGLAVFDHDPLPGVDYHLVKQAVRQGLVDPAPEVARKLRMGELLSEEESLPLRAATLEALAAIAREAGASSVVLDNMYWLNRRVCSEELPACVRGETCPFEPACARRTEYGLPLELTRYY